MRLTANYSTATISYISFSCILAGIEMYRLLKKEESAFDGLMPRLIFKSRYQSSAMVGCENEMTLLEIEVNKRIADSMKNAAGEPALTCDLDELVACSQPRCVPSQKSISFFLLCTIFCGLTYRITKYKKPPRTT